MTGAFTTGLAHLSLDPEYKARREKEKYSRPENIGEGIVQGSVQFTTFRNILISFLGLLVSRGASMMV